MVSLFSIVVHNGCFSIKLLNSRGTFVFRKFAFEANWDFESYNTNTEFVIDHLLRPTNFANLTIAHKPNRAVIFDSALFHQTDRYRFKKGYENGRINLTLLFGEMKMGDGEDGTAHGASAGQEL